MFQHIRTHEDRNPRVHERHGQPAFRGVETRQNFPGEGWTHLSLPFSHKESQRFFRIAGDLREAR